jgi:hypothetical protein
MCKISPLFLPFNPAPYGGADISPRESPSDSVGTLTRIRFDSNLLNHLKMPAENDFSSMPYVGEMAFSETSEVVQAGRDTLSGASFIVYDEASYDRIPNKLVWYRAVHGQFIKQFANNKLLLVRRKGEEHLRPLSADELIGNNRLLSRFKQSTVVNTVRYLLPLLYMARVGTRPAHPASPREMQQWMEARIKELRPSTFAIFCSASFLFDFHVVANAPAHGIYRIFRSKSDPAEISPYYSRGMIVGTGKYPPERGTIRENIKAMIDLGLLEDSPNAETLTLTDAGCNFHSMLPKSSFDPDCMLRWMKKNDESGAFDVEAASAIDRWQRTFYGAIRKAAIRHYSEYVLPKPSRYDEGLELIRLIIAIQNEQRAS